jgi:hypothetical protein
MVIDDEIKDLFDLVRKKLGAPIREVELTDEQLCALLTIAIGNYTSEIHKYVIESNWLSFYGKTGLKSMSTQDWAWSLSVRTFDMAKSFSYYFSKEIGLQQRGPWELKKDYFEIEPGRQVYVIPANREINKVLYFTNPTTDSALFANYGGITAGFGGGVVGQLGLGCGPAFAGMAGAGFGGMYAMPLYDVALASVDMKEKNKFLGCDLVYKVTAGPEGTRLIHLESVPGGKFERMGGFGRKHDLYCWYTYYDTSQATSDECNDLLANGGLLSGSNGDVLLSPDQVPLGKMDYRFLNEQAKNVVRQLLVAESAETLGLVRGKFSGSINMINSPLTMDYNMLISLGQREKDNAMQSLKEWLDKLSPYNQMEKEAQLVESLIRVKRGVPLGFTVK